jgi:hypothetical protein
MTTFKMKTLGSHEGCGGTVKVMASGSSYCGRCREASPKVMSADDLRAALKIDDASLVALVAKAVRS